MGQEDAELVRRWQDGKASAFEALVRRWQEPISRFVARLAGSNERAQDLCQEVFLRLYQAGPRYRERGAFSTWLYQIALNVARDAARRRRRPETPWPSALDPAAAAPLAETLIEQQELAQAVSAALAELPASLREPLVLRHYEGMSFEEMARLLGAPASTLKSRFAAALVRLRIRLRQLGWSPEETTS